MAKRKYNINYDEKVQIPYSDKFFKAPLTEEEFNKKYGADADEIWNYPNSQEELMDIFGESILYVESEDQMVEKYGEYGEYLWDAVEYVFDKLEEEGKEFTSPSLQEIKDAEQRHKDKLEEDREKEFEKLEENSRKYRERIEEYERKEAKEKEKERIAKEKDYQKNKELYEIQDLRDGVFKSFERVTIGYQIDYANVKNPPKSYKFEGDEVLSPAEALIQWRNKNNIAPSNDYLKVLATPITEPYAKGRFKNHDNEVLNDTALSLARMERIHSSHSIIDIIFSPVKYYREYKAIKDVKDFLKDAGFASNEIEAKTQEKKAELIEQELLEKKDDFDLQSESELENDERVFEKNSIVFNEKAPINDDFVKENDGINIQIENKKDNPEIK